MPRPDGVGILWSPLRSMKNFVQALMLSISKAQPWMIKKPTDLNVFWQYLSGSFLPGQNLLRRTTAKTYKSEEGNTESAVIQNNRILPSFKSSTLIKI